MAKMRPAVVLEAPIAEMIGDQTLGDLDMDKYVPFSQERFESRGGIEEGVSGRVRIDTSFENTECSEPLSGAPRAF